MGVGPAHGVEHDEQAAGVDDLVVDAIGGPEPERVLAPSPGPGVCEVGVADGETAAVEPTDEPASDERAPLPGTTPPSRSAKRIVMAVVVAIVALAGLAWWVLALPYEVSVTGTTVSCDDLEQPTAAMARRDISATQDLVEVRLRCDDDREARRNTALFAGAAVAIAACAVSTVPSRRLTGEKLGPLR